MNDEKGKVYLQIDEAVLSEPENCAEILHKYGTYELQPTSATENDFPKIAQGLAKKENRKKLKDPDTGEDKHIFQTLDFRRQTLDEETLKFAETIVALFVASGGVADEGSDGGDKFRQKDL